RKCAGQTLAAATGQVALDRHADSVVRAGYSLSHGDAVFSRGAGRDEISERWRARANKELDVFDAATNGEELLSGERNRATARRADVCRVRSADQPQSSSRKSQGRCGNRSSVDAPGHKG